MNVQYGIIFFNITWNKYPWPFSIKKYEETINIFMMDHLPLCEALSSKTKKCDILRHIQSHI